MLKSLVIFVHEIGHTSWTNDVQLLPFHLSNNLFRSWCSHSMICFGPQKTLTHTPSVPQKAFARSSHPVGWLVRASTRSVLEAQL